eukprot:7313378-Prymnesium_polylepis.1
MGVRRREGRVHVRAPHTRAPHTRAPRTRASHARQKHSACPKHSRAHARPLAQRQTGTAAPPPPCARAPPTRTPRARPAASASAARPPLHASHGVRRAPPRPASRGPARANVDGGGVCVRWWWWCVCVRGGVCVRVRAVV